MKKSSIVKNLLLALAVSASSGTSCKKDCAAGSGGDVTLILKPVHHTNEIYSSTTYRDSAFIKFNATDFPGVGASKYDLVVAGNVGENFVRVPGLKCGQYYLYMTGFDTSATWNIRVFGGIPYEFSETSGEINIVVPVNE